MGTICRKANIKINIHIDPVNPVILTDDPKWLPKSATLRASIRQRPSIHRYPSCRMIRPTPASLAASTAILDRGYGKAPASLEVTTLEMISARFFLA